MEANVILQVEQVKEQKSCGKSEDLLALSRETQKLLR